MNPAQPGFLKCYLLEASASTSSTDFGIGLEVALYVPALDDTVIEHFISQFNNGTFKADPTLYSFKSEE